MDRAQLLGPAECRNMALMLEWCCGGYLRPDVDMAPRVSTAVLARLGSAPGVTVPDEKARIDALVRLGVARAVACGLEYLHRMHEAHEDVKPLNIMFKRWPPAIPGVVWPWSTTLSLLCSLPEACASD